MGAEEGKEQNSSNVKNNGKNEENNISDSKKSNKKKKEKNKDNDESSEDDEEEEEEESDEEESEKKDKNKSSKNSLKGEKEKEIKPQLEKVSKNSEKESIKSNKSKKENKKDFDDEEEEEEEEEDDEEKRKKKENKDKENKKDNKEDKESSDISNTISKEVELNNNKDNKMNDNKERVNEGKKKTVLQKNYKDVLPGEIPEERKLSQAAKLSFGYKCCQTIDNAHKKEITTLCYILKRNEIATGSVDETIKIWKINYKKSEISLYKELIGHEDSITCIKDFPQLNCFCSTSSDLSLKLWDSSSLKCLKTLKYHTKCILTCCYNPIGKKEIFSGGDDLDIIVWSTPKDIKDYSEFKCLKGHKKRISSLAFADEYNYLMSGSDDKTLRIWDLKNTEDIQCIKVITDLMSEIDFLLYLDNRLLVGCEDGVISFIKMNKLKRCRSIKFSDSPIYSFYIFHKHRYLIIGSKDGKTRVWKIGTNKREILKGHSEAVTGVCDFEDDFVVTASMDKSIKLWKKDNT